MSKGKKISNIFWFYGLDVKLELELEPDGTITFQKSEPVP
jgi:hypothetical protein